VRHSNGTGGKTSGLLGTASVENAHTLLVRMGRLELPRPLQALEPKCILEIPSGTKFPTYQIVTQQQPQGSSSEERLNPVDKLRPDLLNAKIAACRFCGTLSLILISGLRRSKSSSWGVAPARARAQP